MKQKIHLFIAAVQSKGVFGTLQVGASYIWDHTFDLRYGTDTMSWVKLSDLEIDAASAERGIDYQPTAAVELKALFLRLRLPRHYTFVDIGCGKGRVLLIGAEYGFNKVRGIEFSSRLCEIARQNIEKYKEINRGKIQFEIFEGDASIYNFCDDENVIFLFNPFDDI